MSFLAGAFAAVENKRVPWPPAKSFDTSQILPFKVPLSIFPR